MGKFVLRKEQQGFRLSITNQGQPLLISHTLFTSKKDCVSQIKKLQDHISTIHIEDHTSDFLEKKSSPKLEIHQKNDQFYFTLFLDDPLFATSSPFSSKIDCINGIDSLIHILN